MLAVGVYSAKRGTSVLARVVEARVGKPSLVRETSRLTPAQFIQHPIKVRMLFFSPPPICKFELVNYLFTISDSCKITLASGLKFYIGIRANKVIRKTFGFQYFNSFFNSFF